MPYQTAIYEVFQGKDLKWRVRFIARNGEKWNGTQKYSSKSAARHSAIRQRLASEGAQIVVRPTKRKKVSNGK